MKEIVFEKDIHLICKRAINFPEGVSETFKNLENSLDNISKRDCFGVYEENLAKSIIVLLLAL